MASAITDTVHVDHLGGIDTSYKLSQPYDPSKPTCVFVNSFTMTYDLYDDQFKDKKLLDTLNIIAIEPLGHGYTRSKSDTFTFWDTAIMNFQVLDALKITGKVFALGTSQGGWIVVRMALLQPEGIAGLVLLGTSMDYESERGRKLGNYDAFEKLSERIQEFSSTKPTPDFVIPESFREFPIYYGFGKGIHQTTADWWHEKHKSNYSGDDGRRRLKEVTVNLRDRDGLYGRLMDVQSPILWLHGTKDAAFSVANAEEEIKLFVNSPDVSLQIVEDGQHYLNASHPEIVDEELIKLVQKYSK